ncbi:MAG: L-threonylcarbamoyladenylate synthase [Isosphaeraceae bacterium]
MAETRRIQVDRESPEPSAIAEAAAVLAAGGLIAFPTETVYGLGADATRSEAVAKIYQAKGRPPANPLIVHVSGVSRAKEVVTTWPETAERLATRFWPGPLTLVLPRSPRIVDAVSAGLPTVGVRVPDCRVALALLARFGVPVAAPSANRSASVSPTRAEHVLKDLDGAIDLVLDAGPAPVGIESTVLDLSAETPVLLRPGAITAGQIEAVLGRPVRVPPRLDGSAELTSPGQLPVHYAPRTPLVLVEPDQLGSDTWRPGQKVALLAFDREPTAELPDATIRYYWADPASAGRWLYETFHQCDDDRLDLIVAVVPPDIDEWRAVRDRLWRASRRWAREGLGD